jgi:hypothetical protein
LVGDHGNDSAADDEGGENNVGTFAASSGLGDMWDLCAGGAVTGGMFTSRGGGRAALLGAGLGTHMSTQPLIHTLLLMLYISFSICSAEAMSTVVNIVNASNKSNSGSRCEIISVLATTSRWHIGNNVCVNGRRA